MACIGKLRGSVAMECGAPRGAFNRIQGAKLLNASDIASFTVSKDNLKASITLTEGAVGYDVTTVNNAFTLNVAMKSQDIMPGAFDVSVGFKLFSVRDGLMGLISEGTPMGGVGAAAKLELVVAVDHGNGNYRVYGLGAPLVCLEYNMDSTGDGYVALTYGVEDWQVGTTIHWIEKEDYDALSTPQPAPELEP